MNNLRRRELAVPEWDYVWDYTMGGPASNGWTLNKTTNAKTSMVDGAVRLETSGNSQYISYSVDNTNADVGVIEAKMLVQRRASNDNGYGRLCFSNGTDGIHVIMVAKKDDVTSKFLIWDSSNASEMTQLGSFTKNTYYVVRIELNNGVGKVYINGNLVASGIQSNTCRYATKTRFGCEAFTEYTNHYAQFEYVKIKVGRL